MAFEPQAGTNYYPRAVLWIGIILIFLNTYANGGWSYLWSAVTTSGTTAAKH